MDLHYAVNRLLGTAVSTEQLAIHIREIMAYLESGREELEFERSQSLVNNPEVDAINSFGYWVLAYLVPPEYEDHNLTQQILIARQHILKVHNTNTTEEAYLSDVNLQEALDRYKQDLIDTYKQESESGYNYAN